MGYKEAALLALATYAAALVGFMARIMFVLGAPASEPPEDAIELKRWTRRRRWLVASEFAALPMFSALSMLAAYDGWLTPVGAVAVALAAGALGFAFFIHALEAVVRRRLALPPAPNGEAGR